MLFNAACYIGKFTGGAAQRHDFPAQATGTAMQRNMRSLSAFGAIKGDRFLRKPLKDAAIFHVKLSLLVPGNALTVSFIKLVSRRGGEQRMSITLDVGANRQVTATD